MTEYATGDDAVRKAKLDRDLVTGPPAVRLAKYDRNAQLEREKKKRRKPVPQWAEEIQAVRAAMLAKGGLTYAEIALQLDMKGGAPAISRLLKRSEVAAMPFPVEADSVKLVLLAKHLQAMQNLEQIILTPAWRTDVKGMLVLDPDDQPIRDFDQAIRAHSEYRHEMDAVSRLLGLDAPSQKNVKITNLHQRIAEAASRLGMDINTDVMDIVDAEVVSESAAEPNLMTEARVQTASAEDFAEDDSIVDES